MRKTEWNKMVLYIEVSDPALIASVCKTLLRSGPAHGLDEKAIRYINVLYGDALSYIGHGWAWDDVLELGVKGKRDVPSLFNKMHLDGSVVDDGDLTDEELAREIRGEEKAAYFADINPDKDEEDE
jgi:hypothetical protein